MGVGDKIRIRLSGVEYVVIFGGYYIPLGDNSDEIKYITYKYNVNDIIKYILPIESMVGPVDPIVPLKKITKFVL